MGEGKVWGAREGISGRMEGGGEACRKVKIERGEEGGSELFIHYTYSDNCDCIHSAMYTLQGVAVGTAGSVVTIISASLFVYPNVGVWSGCKCYDNRMQLCLKY